MLWTRYCGNTPTQVELIGLELMGSCGLLLVDFSSTMLNDLIV